MNKALLFIAILGLISSIFLKEWINATLWVVVIIQDLQIAQLESENEK